MKVGILDLLSPGRSATRKHAFADYMTTRQYASVMPQAIAVWCRQLGHQVFYDTFYGQSDPKRLLPDDLDVVFISGPTMSGPLAYALSKLYKGENTLTVTGGPHAKAFPQDCLRYFDLVVTQCDKQLITEILNGDHRPGGIVSSERLLSELPSVEERMPEVKIAGFFKRTRPFFGTMVPLLASLGCPYSCNFCTDWSNPYVVLQPDQLEADLNYLSRTLPGVKITFHDPNFAVKFDDTLDVLERIPEGQRNPYVMESSLSVIKESRLRRLRDTNCFYIAPGIESWSDYSNKAGVGSKGGMEKVRLVADHIEMLHSYVPGIQVNFMFGLDSDVGDEPVELTKEFMTRTPWAWPVVNIPMPFGGTPLFDQYLKEERVLESMPFSFYYSPYLVTTLKNYDPITYYRKLIDILDHRSTGAMLLKRLRVRSSASLRLLVTVRNLRAKESIKRFRQILNQLTIDHHFREFHEGTSKVLPEFYHQQYEQLLGPYASLMPREERTPILA